MEIKEGRKKNNNTLASITSISIVVDTGGIWTGQRFITWTTSFQACLLH